MGADFIPYRACDLEHEPSGYVQVHVDGYGPVWARLERLSDSVVDESAIYRVVILGWGESSCVFLSELSIEDQQKLLLVEEIIALERLIDSRSEALRSGLVTPLELKQVSLLLEASVRKLEGRGGADRPLMRMAAGG
ncbi:MAG TPA: hypothetical protein VJH03_22770 [Blastocatellia bacterium]|nr:hypothetical protein [Blastocatellia bacterium]